MKLLKLSCLLGSLLAFVGGTALAADAAVGTWSLNLAKSTMSGAPLKSQTRIYTESAGGVALTVKTVTADGKEATTTLAFKEDGKDNAVTGTADFDAVAVKRVDANTIEFVQKKAGKVVGNGRRTMSADGKTLTFKSSGVHADGAKFEETLVYDRK